MPSPSPVADAASGWIHRARPLLGTLVDIGAAGSWEEAHLHAAIDAAFAAVGHVHALMSYHDPHSELSRVNRHAAAVKQRVHAYTYRVIEAGLSIAASSEGAFDAVVAARLESLGYLPTCGGKVDAGATWRDVELTDGECVRFLRPLRLDLGGIAKGFAVDLAIAALLAQGTENCIVNAGGDLRVAGCPRRVDLRHPANPFRLAHRVTLQNQALATSAVYFSRREVEGRMVSALIDPRGGRPYLSDTSVSVVARECMVADALTKVMMFADASNAERSLSEHEAEALLLSAANPIGNLL